MSIRALLGSILLIFLSFNVGCSKKGTEGMDAKAVLTEYISVSFAAKVPEDRKRLLTYLTGETKVRMQNWSDEQFMQAFVDTRRNFVKLAFKEFKKVHENEASLTYDLIYDVPNARITQRKLAQMVKPQGAWLIQDVKNIKEVVEYKNELAFP